MVRREVARGVDRVGRRNAFAEAAQAARPRQARSRRPVRSRRKEGRFVLSALELNVGGTVAKVFEAKYPAFVRAERPGAERDFPAKIAQEQASNHQRGRNVANSTESGRIISTGRRKDWLAPYLPDDVAKHFPAAGGSDAWYRPPAPAGGDRYKPNLVKREDAPKSYAISRSENGWQNRQGHPRL